ncbi:MAG TPA: hypothetical protein VFZ22_12045 [Pyrinomonadaceae bacterium]|nr:hypothetical protein [Pyrinomonadaceae bacterium]
MAELFDTFEVNREPKWPIISRLIGASAVLHLVLLWVVIYVPAVRDTVNLAALIANSRFVDEDYVATQIGDEVQIVNVEKFHYPEGYFADPAQLGTGLVAAANDPFAPKIISQWNPKERDPEALASPSPSPEPSASPSASPTASASPSAIAQAGASPSPTPAADANQEAAQKELEKMAAEGNIGLPDETQINKKPLKDLATYANNLSNEGKLDLTKPFKIVIEATWDEKGRLQNPHPVEQTGDENLNSLFKRMIAALNDSGLLIYLSPISKENVGSMVRITVNQGEAEVLASFEMETKSPDKASIGAKGLNGALVSGAILRAGKDEAVIIKNTTASADGKRVLVNFSMPRQNVIDMLKKQVEPGA